MENEEKKEMVDSVPLILIILILHHIVIPLLVLHLKARLIISNILITPSSILDNDIISLNGDLSNSLIPISQLATLHFGGLTSITTPTNVGINCINHNKVLK